MNKRLIISKEEKNRILNLHKNFDFKKLIKESKENNLLLENTLNDKGQYVSKGAVKIQVHGKGGPILPIKAGTMFYGDKGVIRFYVTNIFQDTCQFKCCGGMLI